MKNSQKLLLIKAITLCITGAFSVKIAQVLNIDTITFNEHSDKIFIDFFRLIFNIIDIGFYLTGIILSLKGFVKFLEFLDERTREESIFLDEKKNDTEQKSLLFLENKKIIDKKESIKIPDFLFNLDFENEVLNDKLYKIEKMINSILYLPVLEKDIKNKILVSSTQEKYIQQIHKAYIAIPLELRNKQIVSSTATLLAMEQLVLVENGLIEIENELLSQQIQDLNIMNRFLKDKFPEQKSYLTITK